MREGGKMTEDMQKGLKNTAMATLTRENSVEAKPTVTEFINGRMERFMKVNGSMARKMARANGEVRLDV